MQRLVETAMLAAVGGVVYVLASILKLQSYLGYFQPMPVVVSAMRWGPAAGRKTMTATCFLLLGEHRVQECSCFYCTHTPDHAAPGLTRSRSSNYHT